MRNIEERLHEDLFVANGRVLSCEHRVPNLGATDLMRIPKFEDGEFLSETELYQLAWIPFHLFRLSSRGQGHAGFFSPDASGDVLWNHFDQSDGRLVVDRLFVLSAEGIPFISATPVTLDLTDVTVDRTTLFASAYFAESSEAFRDEGLATLGPGSVTHWSVPEEDSPDTRNAYMLGLHWGEDAAPVVPGTKHFQLELGTLEGSSGETFRPSPVAYVPSGLPVLAREVRRFRTTVEMFQALLLDPDNAPGVDRTQLLDRLELVERDLMGATAPTARIIGGVGLALRAAKGFYLRIAYAQSPDDPRFQECRGLEGRLLEHRLEQLQVGRRDPVGSMLADLDLIGALDPSTGYEQVDYFRLVGGLFEADRQTELFASLSDPPTRTGPAPRAPKPEPRIRGPRIIPLDKRDD